jgi:hypothetical protein
MRTGRRTDIEEIGAFCKFTNVPKSASRYSLVHGFDATVDETCHCNNFHTNRTKFFLDCMSSVLIYVAQPNQKRCIGVREHLGRFW